MNRINFIVRWVFGLMMAWVLAVLALCGDGAYVCKKPFLARNAVLLPAALAAVAAVALVGALAKGDRPRNSAALDRLAAALSLALLIAQVYAGYCVLFKSGWEVLTLVDNARAVAGYGQNAYFDYFSRYPNNLTLLTIYSILFKANAALGFFQQPYDLMSIVIVNALVNATTCFLIYRIARRLADSRWGFVAFALGVLLVGTSPWTVICYSDGIALLFPTLILWLYTLRARKAWVRTLKTALILVLACVGYLIKPYTLIAPMAILIITAAHAINRDRKRTFAVLAITTVVALCFVGLIGGANYGLVRLAETRYGFTIDREGAFSWPHFLLMGMNAQTQGIYSEDDVIFSGSFPTRAERSRNDLREAFRRVREMGLSDLFELLKQKTLITYNDGTFAWGFEGYFYMEYYETPKLPGASFLREFIYEYGRYKPQQETARQFMWLTMLLAALVSVFMALKVRRRRIVLSMLLALIGFSLYEAMFEVRARYMYIYAPYFVILAGLGLKTCAIGLRRLMGRRRTLDKQAAD